MPEFCGRTATDGNNTRWLCLLPAHHDGDHRATWTDRDGREQLGIQWSHEINGSAVWPSTPGAEKVST